MLVRSIIAALVLAGAVPAAAQGPSLAQRVDRVEADAEIRRVLIEYGKYLDTHDYAAYAKLFTEDGVWTGGFGSFTGRASIEKMLVDYIGAPEPGFVNKSSYHMLTNPLITVDGNRAKVESKFLFWTATPDNFPSPSHAGRYVDEFVKVGGAWKIARRTAWGEIPYLDPNAPNGVQPPSPARSDAARLQRLEDQEAIRNLLLEYGRSYDERRLEDYANLFAEDGTWGGGPNPVKGPGQILEMVKNSVASLPPSAPGMRNFHVMTNMMVDVDGDTATAWSRYTFYVTTADGQPKPAVSGVYDDKLISVGGKWKFLSRKLTQDSPLKK